VVERARAARPAGERGPTRARHWSRLLLIGVDLGVALILRLSGSPQGVLDGRSWPRRPAPSGRSRSFAWAGSDADWAGSRHRATSQGRGPSSSDGQPCQKMIRSSAIRLTSAHFEWCSIVISTWGPRRGSDVKPHSIGSGPRTARRWARARSWSRQQARRGGSRPFNLG
jgi:hypothetical protein